MFLCQTLVPQVLLAILLENAENGKLFRLGLMEFGSRHTHGEQLFLQPLGEV
jgi:hypothetical protein